MMPFSLAEIGPTTQDSTSVLTSTPEVVKNTEKLTIDDIATVARASTGEPMLNPSVAKVTDQLIDTIGQMVEKDIRTPPKLKEVIKEKNESFSATESSTNSSPSTATVSTTIAGDKVEANGRFQVRGTHLSADHSEGKAASVKKEDTVKGVAVPVIMDEDLEAPPKKLQKIPNVAKPTKEEKKKLVTTNRPTKETPTTTPSSGLSTWILLSDNREATTPTSSKKKNATPTTKKPAKTQSTTVKIITAKPAKKTTPKPEKKEPISALEAMVKNKNTATPRPAQKKKGDVVDVKENTTEKKKVATIPPAILIETTEASVTEITNTETTLETTTKKKKKNSSKKKKKNSNRRKKPSEKSGAEQVIKDLVKQPKQPVGAQFYNFLSREIMPTVGLGLVGVLVTAGLAGLLGYNPFVGTNLPVRRTYESQHGYQPNGNYYNYNSEYGDSDGGKNEEVLFREVLSGMPEDSRYGLPHGDVSYPESQLYTSQEQAYDAAKNPTKKTETGDSYSNLYDSQYDSYTNKEQVGSKYPVYSGGAFVYPEKSTTEKFKASSKYSDDATIEKQPEALYRVSSDYSSDDTSGTEGTNSDTAWHRIGSPMDYSNQPSHLEPGPRRLDLDKMTEKLTEKDSHKRSKRSPEGILARIVRRSNEVVNINLEDERENEIDSDDGEPAVALASTTENPPQEVTTLESTTKTVATPKYPTPAPEDDKQPSLIDSFPSESSPSPDVPPSLMDVLRRLAQFKLRLGINFLKATTEAFGKYLEGVQQRVEDSMANDTTFPAMRYAWLGGRQASEDDNSRVREKRYQRDAGEGDIHLVNDYNDYNQEAES